MKNLSISTSIIALALLTALLSIQCKTNETVTEEEFKEVIEKSIKEAEEAFSDESTVNVVDVRHIDERMITGQVFDERGEGIIGANILVKGTTTGTITDLDGSFSLLIPDDATTLIVTYAGYESQEVDIRTLSELVVSLSTGTSLDEVVVTGYSRKAKASPEADYSAAASALSLIHI